MPDLTESDRIALRAITAGTEACCRTEVLAFRLGLGPLVAGELLTRLESAGLVECWRPKLHPRLALWTLTPLAAEAIGVHLVECGVDELWRWDTVEHDEPPSRQPSDPALDGHPPRPDLVSLLGLEAPATPARRKAWRPA